MALQLQVTPAQFHQDMFGVPTFFPHCRISGNWAIYQVANWTQPTVWRGDTLHELHQMLQTNSYRAGMWHTPTISSPLGIYCASTPSAALDKASLRRGYAFSHVPPIAPNGWDCPIVVGMGLNLNECGMHGKLRSGAVLRRKTISHNYGPGAPLPLQQNLNIQEVRFYIPLYQRYQELPAHWPALQRGDLVLCRAKHGCPNDFFTGGHGPPLSCGRVTADPKEDGWMTTCRKGTQQWRCPTCHSRYNQYRSTVTGEI